MKKFGILLASALISQSLSANSHNDGADACDAFTEEFKAIYNEPMKISSSFSERYGCWIHADTEIDLAELPFSDDFETKKTEAKAIYYELKGAVKMMNRRISSLAESYLTLKDTGIINTFSVEMKNVDDDIKDFVHPKYAGFTEYSIVNDTTIQTPLVPCDISLFMDLEESKKVSLLMGMRQCDKIAYEKLNDARDGDEPFVVDTGV